MSATANTYLHREPRAEAAYVSEASMLPELLTLEIGGEEIENVEGLCRGVLKRLASGVTPRLEPCEWEDALAFLLGEAYVQSALYDASRAGIRPRPWLFDRLGKRLIDEWRSRRCFGRDGQYRTPIVVDDDDPGVDRLEGASAAVSSDRAEDWADALEWLYVEGDRETLREERRLGLETPGRAQAGPDRPGALTLVRDLGRAPGADRVAAPWRDCACGWRIYAQAPNGYPGWHYPERCPACGSGLA